MMTIFLIAACYRLLHSKSNQIELLFSSYNSNKVDVQTGQNVYIF
ncbi:hypothetical protein [Confluentibacter citreus]|nr:hypothetical protein [Confluentibacter citreus]